MYWVLAGGVVFAALAAFEVLFLRPGLGAPEELLNVGRFLDPAGSVRFWLRIGGGAVSQGLMSLALAGPWGWQSIYLFNALALGGEACGLWWLGRRLGGEAAAVWALAFAFCSPFSFLQARTTFTYVLVPALLLGMVLALRRPLGRAASAALGLAAALAWLDYEAWILALPALVFAWHSAPRDSRARGPWILAGALAGCMVLAGLEAPFLAEWLAVRGQAGVSGGRGLFTNLKGFFFGGEQSMGLERLAAFPWPAWPGLLVGLVVAPAWLWIWALGGLLGLAAGGPFLEPNRGIVAWPALLLISGLGTAWLWRRFFPRVGPAGLGVLLLAAPVMGYLQFDRAIVLWDADIHGPSREVFQMARFLEQRSHRIPVVLGPSLDLMFHPLLGRIVPDLSGSPPRPGAETWFLVPRSMADPSDPRWGRWVAFSSDGDPYPQYLLLAGPRAKVLLEQAAQDLAPEGRIMASPGRARLDALRALCARARNPWSWTAWSGLLLQSALGLGKVQAEDVLPLLDGPCIGSEPLETIRAALSGWQP
ncbi:MAG TPA: hypothetical protein VK786_07590, partial [bacterium]|nr:hypothetical protein [bacterium]